MAKLHSKKRWTDAEYKAAYRELRPFVGYQYDLRRRLTPGQKSAIRKSANNAKKAGLYSNAQAKIHKVPRKAHESKRAYSQRLREIKANAGQSNTGLRGVVLAVPGNGRVNFKTGEIITRGPTYEERYYAIDPQQFAADPRGTAEDVAAAAFSDGADNIAPIFGHVNRGQQYLLPADMGDLEDEEDYLEFLDFVDDIGEQYGTTDALTGFIGIRFL